MNAGGAGQPNIDVVDLVEESVAVFTLDLHVTAWNAAAERIYGWKREEVIGGVIQNAVKCSPSDPLKVILAQVQETGIWCGEFTRRAKNGDSVVVQAKWSLRRDAQGNALDIVETSRDITDVRRTEEALDRVQYQYQNLFHASVAAFWELEFAEVGSMVRALLQSGIQDLRAYFRINPDYVRRMIAATRIVNVNDQCLLMFGNGDTDALMRSLNPFWPDESLEVFAESVVAAFEKQPHFSSEAVFYSLDGQRYDTLFTVSYPPELRHASRILVGITDVTQAKKSRVEQEKSDRRYRDMFHNLPVSLLRVDSRGVSGMIEQARSENVVDFAQYMLEHPELTDRLLDGVKVVEVNRRTVNMFRAPSTEALLTSVAPYWTESPEGFRAVMAARYSRQPGFETLVKMPALDGTILDVLFFQTFTSITGEESSSLVQMIDVSGQVKAQDMLAQVQAEIAHAARVSILGELTASIAHEISQPLTAIEANTEAAQLWLAQSPPNIAQARNLATNTAIEVQRAADIIHRIRSMALRAPPAQKPVNLNPIIEEAALFLTHELQRNGVEATLRLDADLPHILGDRVQLQQVIVNLAINGIQAMANANSATRRLGIATGVTADGAISVEVEDSGPGIAADAFERLFDSFFTTKASGMGIGLPICQSIIEAHGGEIKVANKADAGAKFTIRLPLFLKAA